MAPSLAAYLGLVGAIALQRLWELRRSKRHIGVLARAGRRPEREPAYIAMVSVHALALVCAPLEVLLARRLFVPAVGIPALAVLLCAQVCRAWVLRTLGGAWNVRVVQPNAIVVSGPYRFVRHPNYLIVCCELLALPLVHGAWLTAGLATVANALVLRGRIALEESVLARDPAWVQAFGRVPRFIPRLRVR